MDCWYKNCDHSSWNNDCTFRGLPTDDCTRRIWMRYARITRVKRKTPVICSCHFEESSSLPIPFLDIKRKLQQQSQDDSEPEVRHIKIEVISDTPSGDELERITVKTTNFAVNSSDTYQTSGVAKVHIKQEDGSTGQLTESIDFERSCRFCLAIPRSSENESRSLSEDIATMYRSLTGIEFLPTTFAVPQTICTTCTAKLKNAFEFREHLIRMNNHWQTAMKTDGADETIVIPMEPGTVQLKTEVYLFDDCDRSVENPELVEEFVDYNRLESVDNDADEEKQTAESDEDDQFIEGATNFIKTVKPVPEFNDIPVIRLAKGITLSSQTERLNFRTSSCPHSSQKLKKDNKWWRLMHDCNYCHAKNFQTVEAVQKHLKFYHAGQVKVTCDICKEDYSELKYLKEHMKNAHQTRQNEGQNVHKVQQDNCTYRYRTNATISN